MKVSRLLCYRPWLEKALRRLRLEQVFKSPEETFPRGDSCEVRSPAVTAAVIGAVVAFLTAMVSPAVVASLTAAVNAAVSCHVIVHVIFT